MGVKGLWPMLETAAGKAALENASGKVLAVDISIWIQQIVKGMRDGRGDPIPNAHIIGLVSRIVKLLYFGIKPIFVYDGGTPALKSATVKDRRSRRAVGEDKLVEARQKQLRNKMKRYALGDKTALSTTKTKGKLRAHDEWEADMFDPESVPDLPSVPGDESEAEDSTWSFDASNVDFDSAAFHSLPYEIQHEILVEWQENEKTRSQRTKLTAFGDAESFSRDQVAALRTRNRLSRLLDDIRAKLLCIESENGVSYHKIVSEENTVYVLEKKSVTAPTENKDRSDSEHAATLSPPTSPTKVLRGIARQRFQFRKQMGSEKLEADCNCGSEDSDDSLSFAGSCDGSIHEAQSANETRRTGLDDSATLDGDDDHNLQDAIFASLHASTVNNSEGPDFGASTRKVEVEVDHHVCDDRVGPNSLLLTLDETELNPTRHVHVGHTTTPIVVDNTSESRKSEKPAGPIESTLGGSFRIESPSAHTEGAKSLDIECRDKIAHLVDEQQTTSTLDAHEEAEMVSDTTPQTCMEVEEVSSDVKTQSPCHSPGEIQPRQPRPMESEPRVQNDGEATLIGEVVNETQKHENDHEAIDMIEELASTDELAEGITVHDVVTGAATAASASAALVREQYGLEIEAKRAAQAAAGVSAGMMAETQALLRLFGLPYMVAPMEAEAQCAALELDGVTEGTITDDSDVFLFGGRTVYRRMTSTTKEAEVYTAKAIDQFLGLDREKLIRLAYLLGCDYTPGISGIGVVTAMEIVAEFPGNDCLQRFKEWLHSDDSGGNKVRQAWKQRKKQFLIPDTFPDPRVQQAFLVPQVEKRSLDGFSWGEIDVETLKTVLNDKLGWPVDKIEATLGPALKPSKRSLQPPVTDFFAVDPGQIGTMNRKRFNAAVARVKKLPSGGASEAANSDGTSAKRRRTKGKGPARR